MPLTKRSGISEINDLLTEIKTTSSHWWFWFLWLI